MKFGEYKGRTATHDNVITEASEDDELLRIDIGNNFARRFADRFGMKPANVESRLLNRGPRSAKQLLRVNLGTGGTKIFAGQLIIEYKDRDNFKIARFDGLFDTQDMKKWATQEFNETFKEEIKKGNIR